MDIYFKYLRKSSIPGRVFAGLGRHIVNLIIAGARLVTSSGRSFSSSIANIRLDDLMNSSEENGHLLQIFKEIIDPGPWVCRSWPPYCEFDLQAAAPSVRLLRKRPHLYSCAKRYLSF